MKSTLVLCMFLLVTVAAVSQKFLQKAKQEMVKVGSECAQQEKIGQDEIARLMSKKLPITHEGFCVISCIQKHFGFQTEDGSVNHESVERGFQSLKNDDEEMYNIVIEIYDEACSKITLDGDDCENATEMMKCFMVEFKKRGITAESIGL